jgi:hypothetical protein
MKINLILAGSNLILTRINLIPVEINLIPTKVRLLFSILKSWTEKTSIEIYGIYRADLLFYFNLKNKKK